MSDIKNITIKKEANIYFDGKVTSRTITLEDGSTQSLGIMLPGEYTFSTEDKELMEILSGELSILLPNNDKWQIINAPESFEVPAKSKFSLKINTIVDYCCSYIK